MIIYGVALLSLCTLAGIFVGEVLGRLIGVPANVGGVGIAMLLLIFFSSWISNRGTGLKPKTEQGVEFWSAIYIPIVVALHSGPMAILAGLTAVGIAFALVPVLDRLGRKKPAAAAPAPLSQTAR